MKKILLVWICFIYGLFFSCTQEIASDIFDRVERYMEIYPDSALLLLNRIQHPEKLGGKQRADYALLLTQARDKNYLDSLQSDSLIKLAVDYYRDGDDNVKAGKALFYYGKVAALQDKDTIAIQAYLAAQTKLEKTREYKLQAFVHEYLGRLNNDRGIYDTALDNFRKSVCYYQEAGDTLGVVYNYRNMARIYDIKQNRDSSFWYLNSGIVLLEGDSTAPVLPSLLQMLGIAEKKRGNYSIAVNHLLTAIRYERNPNSIKHYYFSLGDVYLRMEELDKARKCFKQGLDSKDAFTQSGACNYLYLLEKKKGDYAKALYYKEQSDSLLKIDQNERLRNAISTIQRRYEAGKLRMENKMLEQEKQKQLYFWISISSLLVISCVFLYFWIKKQYRRIYRERLKKHVEKASRVIKGNDQLIGQCFCRIEELQQEKILTKEMAEEQIAELRKRIQVLVIENKTIREESCAIGVYVLEQLRKKLLVIENMTSKEKSQVFEYMDLLFNKFASRLKMDYNLNENNLLLAVLVKLGFSSTELMFAFQSEMNSILKKKQRLKSKFCLGADDNLEAYLNSYSLHLST